MFAFFIVFFAKQNKKKQSKVSTNSQLVIALLVYLEKQISKIT